MKRILITGAGSYIGTSVEKWLNQPQFAGMYHTDTIDMRGEEWKKKNFLGYDTVLHVAGIAHADIGKATEEQKKLYYTVNCDLAVETARKAKMAKIKQFIYMSSIIVYGEGTSVRKNRVITRETKPSPTNFYGDSKWRAEQKLMPLSDEEFHVAILRPPMIYGEGCKGNYSVLSKIAQKSPLFPDISNERSMLYIDNLSEFVRLLIDYEDNIKGVYFPQNAEYAKTSDIVRLIASEHKKKILTSKGLNWLVYLAGCCPGKVGKMVNKAFGTIIYPLSSSDYRQTMGEYRLCSFEKSIKKSEKGFGT